MTAAGYARWTPASGRRRGASVRCYAFGVLCAIAAGQFEALAQSLGALGGPQPNLVSNIERPLRYRPAGQDFVIENGTEFFNRPLYGGNTGFRVDAGDKPEFVLYLPGRGGNLRLGLRSSAGAKWLFNAAQITTRYRPGEMHYEIRDPLLGREGRLHLVVLALHQTEGLIARVTAENIGAGLELVWAFGGVNGQRGRRDGDIGTESVPIGEWFQFRPEFCRENKIAIDANRFTLRSSAATVVGTVPAGAVLEMVDAHRWNTHVGPDLAATGFDVEASPTSDATLQIVTGRASLIANQSLFLALQRVGDTALSSAELSTYRDVTTAPTPGARTSPTSALLPPFVSAELPRVFDETSAHFAALRGQLAVETPDIFLNAAVAALNVAADAVWDEPQGVVMHGAIAWRTRLLGWRGPYAMDALGWHERARRHLRYWATRQNTDAIPEKLPPPDENANLARSETALHSNGDMSQSHYDMNLVFIDALFRHLLWTGDREFAREMWPVIERHLAWERRLFRREFGSGENKLPLYEAYAAIWASDDLQYHGGGVTHASAYNFWHNVMAGRIATWLGLDGSAYAAEAALIRRGMNENLWLAEQGMFAEFKDLLGLQRAHPSAALWSFYHPLDAPGLVTVEQAWSMTRYVDREIPRLPVRGPGVPGEEDHHVLATSNWMPYTWSINNVVMGENLHTALGYWRAGRPNQAFRLTKSALLASMFMGICPGNVGSMNYLDVYRRESQRDFADGSGVMSRALDEGLFGLQPDAIAGELAITPGFPTDWERASIRTPTVALRFERDALTSRFVIESKLPGVTRGRLRLPALREDVGGVEINGREVAARTSSDDLGRIWLDLTWNLAPQNEIVVRWAGMPVMISIDDMDSAVSSELRHPPEDASQGWEAPAAATTSVPGEFAPVDLTTHFNDRVTEIFRAGKYRSPRSPFVSLALPAQGIGAWAGHVNATAEIDDTGLRRIAGENDGRITLPNGVAFATPGPGDAANVIFTSLWDNYPSEATVPFSGQARRIHLLMAGSTNHMQSHFDNGEVFVAYSDGSTAHLPLHNPTNWWPIEQDYFIDDFQFRRPGPVPPRVNLKTGCSMLNRSRVRVEWSPAELPRCWNCPLMLRNNCNHSRSARWPTRW